MSGTVTRWPDAHVELARVMVMKGRSGGEIVKALHERFGAVTTRNAVLGVIDRRKGRDGWPPRTRALKTPSGGIQTIARAMRLNAPKTPFVAFTTEEGRAFDLASRRLPLADLERRDCHFPVNDPPSGETYLFCGLPVGAGSYCAHHHRRAYRRRNEGETA